SQTGTQNSHNKSWPSPGHPRRKRYRQKVKRGDCPLASRNIIHVAKSKREDESSCHRDNLRSRRKFPIGFHNEAKSRQGLTERFAGPFTQRSCVKMSRRGTEDAKDLHLHRRPS